MSKIQCPKCGKPLHENVLTSDPPQYELRCGNCGYVSRQDKPHGAPAKAGPLDAEIEELINGNNELRKVRDELQAEVSDMQERRAAATEQPALTPEQAMAELEATLRRLGLVPHIVARGNVTGKVCDITDFMPYTHTPIVQFVKAQ